MQWGATFSHRFAESLGLDPVIALRQLIEMEFTLLRLCVYWDEVEPVEGKFEFGKITVLLDICEKANQPVVLTVGMKAPRWPEFYFPSWVVPDASNQATQLACLKYIQVALDQLQHYTCIQHWQVENEPLDPSGSMGMKIPEKFLEQEIQLVRSLDDRLVVATAWGNEVLGRKTFQRLENYADVLGADLYWHQCIDLKFLGQRYVGPQDSSEKLRNHFQRSHVPVWLTEVQAEPWEKDDTGYRSQTPPSFSPLILQEHIDHVRELNVMVALFWGVEYWLWQAKRGNTSYLNVWNQLHPSA